MSLKLVRQAIEIQGYITIRMSYGEERVTSITGRDSAGHWITNLTDRSGYAKIRITRKEPVIEQAKKIVANEAAIRAKRAEETAASAAWAQYS